MRFFGIILFFIFPFFVFSQYKDSYISSEIQYQMYTYFDSLGIQKVDSVLECDCKYYFEGKFWYFVDRKTSKSSDLDEILLNEEADESYINSFVSRMETYFTPPNKNSLGVNIDINILRKRKYFSPIRLKWKVKYQIDVVFTFNEKIRQK